MTPEEANAVLRQKLTRLERRDQELRAVNLLHCGSLSADAVGKGGEMSAHNALRPWWWWINPWLYIMRRDRAYADALDIIQEICREANP